MDKPKFDETAYKNKFISEKYDRINLTVNKGEKEKISAHAKQQGESVNGFINRAIKETIERDRIKSVDDTSANSGTPDNFY